MELLLLRFAPSALSACRCLEKNELFDAVMGVVGVFEFRRFGGGVALRL